MFGAPRVVFLGSNSTLSPANYAYHCHVDKKKGKKKVYYTLPLTYNMFCTFLPLVQNRVIYHLSFIIACNFHFFKRRPYFFWIKKHVFSS